VVAIERVFSQYNVRTAMGTAQAGGVVALAAARRDLPVMFHTPSEVKAAVTGSGRADKAQVTTMVTRLLNLSERPSPADAADALALAICHIWRGGAQSRLAAAAAQAGQARLATLQAQAAQARSRAVPAQATRAQATRAQATRAQAGPAQDGPAQDGPAQDSGGQGGWGQAGGPR
jgi:crossover junction endodeoxyribonuclease RuvC